ncbi:dihydrolipoamide acetyltransferase family protein [Rhodanobacter sp. AS-Z3]|uniref:dihydrolipoamide acetyltransferase family protein n=1 Tax=Rhodanobacter sp. AS-Z3 TaxID=3031330 RepID=UPI0024784EB2|nr:dihydrolipoamide acetyltransferase family protein [Rhodanobacter sp. AS-Z3]WEN15714.1 dihydrolipoamide acetyltransferase family protein [Rhodanobacter sp. AS-Z3]
MADYIFKLPDVGEGTTEAEIGDWYVKPGDRVEEDQRLVDLMTDKAVVEITSPVAGVVVSTHGQAGEMGAVGAPLVIFRIDGEASESAPVAVAEATVMTSVEAPAEVEASEPEHAFGRPLASPAVRRRAREIGVALKAVVGSGPSGRVTHADLDAHTAGAVVAPVATRSRPTPSPGGITETRIVGVRRKIAERMQEAKRRIPHITYVEELDLTELEDLRTHLNERRQPQQPKLTLLPFFMRALTCALPEFPKINSHYDDEAGILSSYQQVHIGIATQTPSGLLVPVVRDAGALDLWQSATEVARLAGVAREGKAVRDELSGSTITITSMGALGGINATHIINQPEVAIIGPNKLVERPVVYRGQIAIRKVMNLSSSFDHRIVDGYDAAQFVQRLKQLLEHPATLFIEQS